MMDERSKKPTLEQVRTLFPFDVPTLAKQANVATDTLYYALQRYPILRQDAEKIIASLSQHTGLTLSFDHLDIVVWEEFLMLWLIRASIHKQPVTNDGLKDQYHFVYAQDQHHAATLAIEWLKQHPHLSYQYFTAYPEGLTISGIAVPGRQPREADR